MLGGVPTSTLTIRLPDDKHERLKDVARSNSIGINKLMDELATVALANFDARVPLRDTGGAWQSQARVDPARQAGPCWLRRSLALALAVQELLREATYAERAEPGFRFREVRGFRSSSPST